MTSDPSSLASLQAALETAASSGDLLTLQRLLPTWPSSSVTPPPVDDLLALAIPPAHAPTVSYLLSRGATLGPADVEAAVEASLSSSTPSFPILQALLDAGWDPSYSLGHAGDALTIAATESSLPLLSWLLSHGADPNANRCGVDSPLECAVAHASPEACALLLRHGAELKNTAALKLAAYHGRLDQIEFLLQNGADVNEIPDSFWTLDTEREIGLGTALHEAALHHQKGAVELLLQYGADPALKNTVGKTALDIALENGHDAIVDVLRTAQPTA